MTFPTLTLEIAFSTDPFSSSPTWYDASAYLRSFTIRRGRPSRLAEFEAGTLRLKLDNDAREFDPTTGASTQSPNVKPIRLVRLTCNVLSTDYDLFYGFILNWPQRWPNIAQAGATVDLKAVDLFHALRQERYTLSHDEEASGDRIVAVLDELGVPGAGNKTQANWRNIDDGNITIQAFEADDIPALEHLTHVVRAERGFLFVAKDGALTWLERRALQASPYTSSQVTFGDGGGSEVPYGLIQADYTAESIINQVKGGKAGGVVQTASDSDSISDYFTRSRSWSNILCASEIEALSILQHLVYIGKDASFDFGPMVIFPEVGDTWADVLGRELMDRVTVKRRPTSSPVMSQEAHVQSIEHDVNNQDRVWRTRMSVSKAETTIYWLLQDATYGVLGSTAVVGF